MISDSPADTSEEARRRITSDTYLTIRSAVLRYAVAGGAEQRERPVWPGAASTTQYAEPLAGIQAAVIVQDTAARTITDYIRYARADGIGWRRIGEALGLAEDAEKRGRAVGELAYEYTVGQPDLWNRVSFGWDCGACGQSVSDRGPYESHPQDNESGHDEGCQRQATEVAAWQAERDAWEAGQ